MLVGQPPFLANTPAETQYKVGVVIIIVVDVIEDIILILITICPSGDQLGQVYVNSSRVGTFSGGARPHILPLHKVCLIWNHLRPHKLLILKLASTSMLTIQRFST